MLRHAAIVTVGSELTLGLRVDTNTAMIARELTARGFTVAEAVSTADEPELLAAVLKRLTSSYQLVITTGGLGPTHDDITRQAASQALSLPLQRDPHIEALLCRAAARQADPVAAAQMAVQADVLLDAEVIRPVTGTAPGQIVATPLGLLALLPGPPSEMAPMLGTLLGRFEDTTAPPRELGVTQMSESDAQVITQQALAGRDGVGFTVLASPGDVRVILTDAGAGGSGLDAAASAVVGALAERCYTTDGSTLAETVLRECEERGKTIALAESCTGGMVAEAITDIPGSSAVLLGGVVSYSDSSKVELLGVPAAAIDQHGAVSAEVAGEMARGALVRFGCDVAVAITGIAGPGGGSVEKPVGTVWFAVASSDGSTACFVRHYPPTSRSAIRRKATSTALDSIRRAVLGLPVR